MQHLGENTDKCQCQHDSRYQHGLVEYQRFINDRHLTVNGLCECRNGKQHKCQYA